MSNENNYTGITLPYETLAMNGDEMPSGLEYPDQLMFLALRLLYDSFKRGMLDRAAAQREKKELYQNYQCYKAQWDMLDDCAEMFKRTELVRAEFRKNPTVENGWRLVAACEGRKTGV